MLRPRLLPMRLLACLLVCCLLAGGFVLAQGDSPTGQIVYSSDKDGDYELYLLDLETGSETQLTDNDAFDGMPAWSPDGSQIVFNTDRDGSYDIMVINADGSGLVYMNDDPSNEFFPTFSPDGTQLLYSTNSYDNQFDLVVRPVDDRWDITRLTTDGAKDSRPVWSPDGTQILFNSNREGETVDLWVLTVADGALQRLTEDEARDVPLAWHPNGEIIYGSNAHRESGDTDLYAMQLETGEVRNLTESASPENSASMSPDGNWIVYRATVNGNADIYIMDLNGENIQRVTEDAASDVDPAWRPMPEDTAGEAGDTAAATCEVTAPGGVNLRGGPGTTYDLVGGLAARDVATANGQATDGAGYTWYQLEDNGWVREDVVNVPAECAAVPVLGS